MRTPPTPPYNGITILLDKPSRFDLEAKPVPRLMSGQPHQWFDDEILYPKYRITNCDIRDLAEPISSILPGTKLFLLLGRKVAAKFNLSIDRHGYPAKLFNTVPAVVAFPPQECCDHRNIEGDGDEEDEDPISDRDIKDAAPTQRSNYRFWTKWHIRKQLYNAYGPDDIPYSPTESAPDIITYPNLDKTAKILTSIRGEDLFLDIETSIIHRCLTTIGLSSTSIWPTVYVFPIYLYNGKRAYGNWQLLYRMLFCAIKNNQVVAHNSGFDLLVLRAFYKLPFPRLVYDTLRANHRCFPTIEKSLAHVIAQWTRQHYHKDVSTEVFNVDGQHKMWNYNGRDVYNLKLIKDAQLHYAAQRPGLVESINEGNSEIIPYLSNSIQGLPIDLRQLAITHRELSNAQSVLARICAMLMGKPTFNPGSAQQCKAFFHDKLNYPVIARSDKPPFNPKLGKKELYQLLIKTNNPLIQAILRYRKIAKDASLLESELWTPDTQ